MQITTDKYPTPGTILGLHWTPKQYHDVMDLRPFLDRAQEAHVGWMTVIDDGGGSVLQPSQFYGGRTIIEEMHDRDFEIIVRMFAGPQAKFDARMEDAALRLVQAGVHYIFWQNEPECEKWPTQNGNPPADWVEIVFRNWVDGAYKMKSIGAYPGTPALTTFLTPDPDGNIVNPFLTYITEQERQDLFISWFAWVNRHIYPIHHVINYPYDLVNQAGKHLTHQEYLSAIAEVSQAYRDRTGEYWVWENWEDSENHINNQRDEGTQPSCALEDDDVCWLSYRGTIQQLEEAGIADHTIILSTETGPCIGDKGNDGRYPRVTAQAQIRMIDQMLTEAEPPLAGLCFWLAGCKDLNATESNFERQSWWTHAWDEVFELDGEIPLVQHLIDNPGGGELPPPEEPPEEPPMPEPECDNDAVDYGVIVDSADVPANTLYWKCIKVHHLTPNENQGNHNIYVNVFEDGPAWQETVQMFWPDGTATIPLEKDWPNEPMGNGVLSRDAVGVTVLSELDSDRVLGLCTNHGDELKEDGAIGNSNGHHSFLVEWQLVSKDSVEPPAPPTEITDDVIRHKSWDKVGVDYNPDAALAKRAAELGLGKPETQEFDVDGHRAQCFVLGIVFCEIGDWQNIRSIEW